MKEYERAQIHTLGLLHLLGEKASRPWWCDVSPLLEAQVAVTTPHWV